MLTSSNAITTESLVAARVSSWPWYAKLYSALVAVSTCWQWDANRTASQGVRTSMRRVSAACTASHAGVTCLGHMKRGRQRRWNGQHHAVLPFAGRLPPGTAAAAACIGCNLLAAKLALALRILHRHTVPGSYTTCAASAAASTQLAVLFQTSEFCGGWLCNTSCSWTAGVAAACRRERAVDKMRAVDRTLLRSSAN